MKTKLRSLFIYNYLFFLCFQTGRCSFDEQGSKSAIIDALEEFICGDNPQNIFEKMKVEGNSASVCGHVFKLGEPTYCCRECGKWFSFHFINNTKQYIIIIFLFT